MKKNLIMLFFMGICSFAKSQDFRFGDVSTEQLLMTKYDADSSANALVLKEFGITSMQVSDYDYNNKTYLYHNYHVRIKIFNKKGYDKANIVIPLYHTGDDFESISDITGETFTLKNGRIQTVSLDRKKIFKEERNKYVTLTKFTLPDVQEGSVIEFSYSIKSPRIFNFKNWQFQTDIPKLYSEYVALIPGVYNYNVILRGPYKLSDQKAELANECMRIAGTPINCSKMTYIMKDIPAFVEEEFMTAPSNFKSAIYFELSDIRMLNGSTKAFTRDWKSVDYELTSASNFGSQMKKKEVFKDILPSIIKNTTNDLEKAKAVYSFIRKNISWNNYYSVFSEDNIKKALDTHSGNTADINLALIAALSAANLNAEAVILSTRENGVVNKLNPVISEFNYVVAKVNIGDQSYLLDATDPLLPFGLLPLRCINDQGRVINLKKASYWIDLKASLKQSTHYEINGSIDSDGKLRGNMVTYSYGYTAYSKRAAIKKQNSVDEYVEKLDEQMTNLRMLKYKIDNVDSVDNPLVENYDIEMNVYDTELKDRLYFNPFFVEKLDKNPFNMNERSYPVDLGALKEIRINLNLTFPSNYVLTAKPEDIAIGLPANGGRYLVKTDFQDNKLVFNQILQLNKAIYGPEEYFYLKELFSRAIQSQKTDLVLKKSK